MERKIGKKVILVLLSLCFFGKVFSQVSVSLHVKGRDSGGEIKTVGVGIPFLLEVVVDNAPDSIGAPEVDGLEKFSRINSLSMTRATITNGVVSKKRIFQYTIKAAKPGKYILGPALLDVDGDSYRSDQVDIEVSLQSSTENVKDEKKKRGVIVEASVDKGNLFVGEQALFKIKAYYFGGAKIDGISEPDFQKFSATKLEGPFKRREKRGDEVREYFEWRSLIFPKEFGEIVIPAITIQYAVEERDDRSRGLWGFVGLSHSYALKKHAYSNAIKINSSLLPNNKNEIKAIGHFRSFSADVDRKKGQEGEGIILSLTLEGEGNFEMLEYPKLRLPSTLKAYESSHDIVNLSNSLTDRAKKFSYVVQGVKPGTWEIPRQSFLYFDTGSKSYKKIKTNPIMLTIEALASVPVKEKNPDSKDLPQTVDRNDSKVCPIRNYGPWFPVAQHKIPWWIFFVITFCSGIFVFVPIFGRVFLCYRKIVEPERKKRKAFKLARKKLLSEQKKNNILALYDIFNTLISDKLGIDKGALSEDIIAKKFLVCGLEKKKIDEWGDFYSTLAGFVFFREKVDQSKYNKIFEMADKWIEELENIL